MSLEVVALRNARTTFQRVSDAKFFTGWVTDVDSETIAVRTLVAGEVQVGEGFTFEIFGNRKDARLQAHLSGVATLQSAKRGKASLALCILEFKIHGRVALQDSITQPRFLVEGVRAGVRGEMDSQPAFAQVLDIGPGGLALCHPCPLGKGDWVDVEIIAGQQMVKCTCEVRNCVSNLLQADSYRVGLQITAMDRVDALRWKQFYLAVLDANKLDGGRRSADSGHVKFRRRAA